MSDASREGPSDQETPLQAFRERMREVKRLEMEKKQKKLPYDVHFDEIDPDTLGEDERRAYEELPTMSDEEYAELNQRHRDRMRVTEEDLAEMLRDVPEHERRLYTLQLRSQPQPNPKTPEDHSVMAFWQFLGNARMIPYPRRHEDPK